MCEYPFVYAVYSPCFSINANTNEPVGGYPREGEPPMNIVHLENERVYFDDSIMRMYDRVTMVDVLVFIRARSPEATHLYIYNIDFEKKYVDYTFINKEKKLRMLKAHWSRFDKPFVESEWLTPKGE